jgi:hypothetical protein
MIFMWRQQFWKTVLWVILVSSLLFTAMAVWYSGYRWPSPRSYPDIKPMTTEGAVGSWGLTRTQTYTVSQSIEVVQHHYEQEMHDYCIDSWQVASVVSSQRYIGANIWGLDSLPQLIQDSTCQEASCSVRRLWLYQGFEVLFCAVTPEQTVVVQKDLWKD